MSGFPWGRASVPVLAIVCWALHAVLLHWMAGADVVSVLLSGGGASVPMLFGAAAFVALRLFVRLVLPGVILAWAGYVGLGIAATMGRSWRTSALPPSSSSASPR